MGKEGKKSSLETSLVGRKAKCKMSHLWFGTKNLPFEATYNKPLPEDEATIVAVYTSREDGSTSIKLLLESEKGDVEEFYADHISLVPLPKPTST